MLHKLNKLFPTLIQSGADSPVSRFILEKKSPSLRDYMNAVLSDGSFDFYLSLYAQNVSSEDDYAMPFDYLIQQIGIRKDNAKRLLVKLFPENHGWRRLEDIITNGRPAENIVLTYEASRLFATQSRTTKGLQIATFLLHIAQAAVEYDKLQHFMDSRAFKQETLVEANKQYPVVYLADVYFMGADMRLNVVKKIGWTTDISKRVQSLPRDLRATCFFSHVFRCIRSFDLEQMILRSEQVARHRYKDPINGHLSEEIVYFSDSFTEDMLVHMIKEALPEFNDRVMDDPMTLIRLQEERLRIDAINAETERNKAEAEQRKVRIFETHVHTALAQGQSMTQNGDIMKLYMPVLHAPLLDNTPMKNKMGYKVQRINPADISRPIAIYESIVDATRQVPGASKSRIKAAIQNNTLYMDSRWWTVRHDQDQDIVHDLPPLQHMRRVTKGMVAKMDQNFVIKEVFRNQDDATKEAQLKSRASISIACKAGTPSRGHYYKLWDNCSEEQRNEYIRVHGYPETVENAGIRVSRLSAEKEVLEIYPNIECVLKTFQMGRKTLQNAIDNEKVAKGWYWCYTNAAASQEEEATEEPEVTEQDSQNEDTTVSLA